VFQVWVNGKIRGGNHASEAAAMEYIKSMAPGQTQPSFDITPEMRAKVGMGVPLMAQGTPKEIAEAFKKKGYTEKTAREYMENAGVDEKTIGEVIGVFNTLMQKQVKKATGQRTIPIQKVCCWGRSRARKPGAKRAAQTPKPRLSAEVRSLRRG
jgi:hypothetical protein